jgi:hypothetical protein
MTGAGINVLDLVGGFTGFFLTLFVLSYAIGDNALFRLAIYSFVGVSAGFVAAAAFYSVIWPQLLRPLVFGTLDERLFALVPLVLSILLFAKVSRRFSDLGAPVMAFLVGVGAATIIGGAFIGTLLPQVQSTIKMFGSQALVQEGANVGVSLLNGLLVLVGLVVTLASFQFGTRFIRNPSVQAIWKIIYWVGRAFIAITFGVIFAGVYSASITALVERFKSLVDFVLTLVTPV